MVKLQTTYRGRTLEELNAMSMDELIKIMPSRARRTLKRGFTEPEKILLMNVRKFKKEGKGENALIKTHCRNMPILPEMVGITFGVHNGGLDKANPFTKVKISTDMIGHYLGEYAMTRKPVKHNAPGIGATRSSMFVAMK